MGVNLVMIGKRIREARLKKHLSQAELAELIEVSVVYISYLENAKRQAGLKVLDRIANTLEVTVDELLTGNQIDVHTQHKKDIDSILADCTGYEKSILFDAMCSLKKTLRENAFVFLMK